MTNASIRTRFLPGATMAAMALLGAAAPLAHAQAQAQVGPEPSHEARFISRVRAMSDTDLKTFYLGCSRAAYRQELAFGEAAMCSVGYETLLKRTFRGDFMALLAWSRQAHRGRATAD